MSVVGGSAGLAGQPGGVCGVANVQCDGLKRNHVSLSFPDSCPGDVAEIAAQETSHNWGLEHTNVESDLMYPFTNGGFKTFVDDCMAISHATGSGETQCGYVHEIHCPGGEGEQQNSYAELMGVFGPRVLDEEPPEILTIEPADGAAFSTTDSIAIRGTVAENTNFIAIKWTLEGGPEPLTKCTNNVCDQDYELGTGFDPNGETIEFVGLNQAPEGIYTATFEVMDAYGLYDSQTITFSVTEDGMPPMTTGVTDPTGSGSDTDPTASGTADPETSGASNNNDDDDDDDGDTDTDAGIDDGSKGCSCGTGGGAGGLALLVLGAAIRRRRR
jgi:MYXO-CTERM domain-containing protein